MKAIAGLLCLLSTSAFGAAPTEWYGTWIERSATPMRLVVEPAGSAARFTYHMPPEFKSQTMMSFETQFDGKEVPVLVDGKPTDEVMSIKRVDDRHVIGAWKINGKPGGTSRSEMSADGKVVRVDTTVGQQKTTQYWDKK